MKITKFFAKQQHAAQLIEATDRVLLVGGSRSGKTVVAINHIFTNAYRYANTRNIIVRESWTKCKETLVNGTINEIFSAHGWSDNEWDVKEGGRLYVCRRNGSQVALVGLGKEKRRIDRILGAAYNQAYLNECGDLGMTYDVYKLVVSRLTSQHATSQYKLIADLNPVSKSHWTYTMFVRNLDPETNKELASTYTYAMLQMNTTDNTELSAEAVKQLSSLVGAQRKRFWDGEYSTEADNDLFNEEYFAYSELDRYDMFDALAVGIDPAGGGDNSDATGLVLCGKMGDKLYLLEDHSGNWKPEVWAKKAAAIQARTNALLVFESNYGGEIGIGLIRRFKQDARIKKVVASSKKIDRAMPLVVPYSQGSILHNRAHAADVMWENYERELLYMTTDGYIGSGSPDRVDAVVHALAHLDPRLRSRKAYSPRPVMSVSI